MICRICNNEKQNTPYIAREMVFGLREKFEYFECSNCGCLQISKIPVNIEKYYPKDYYSFNEVKTPKSIKIKLFLKRQRTRQYLSGESIIGCIMVKIFGNPGLPDWAKVADLNIDSNILDVGCGSGQLLLSLHDEGYLRLTGVDPFIGKDYYYEGVRILNKKLEELNEQFNFIMLHHSFEHVPDPITTLSTLYEMLSHDGMVLIRIPTVSSFAWRKYKTNWVQLDAPRHFYLHSMKSMEMLCKNVGFRIESIEFDSTAFQFWGSEQYQKDIPMLDDKSYMIAKDKSLFTNSDIIKFDIKAKQLNESNNGDQACFYLRKI